MAGPREQVFGVIGLFSSWIQPSQGWGELGGGWSQGEEAVHGCSRVIFLAKKKLISFQDTPVG